MGNHFFLYLSFFIMLNFFYDSLDTLKKVKRPTRKEVVETTLIIFVVVIISAFILVWFDTTFNTLYKTFYGLMSA